MALISLPTNLSLPLDIEMVINEFFTPHNIETNAIQQHEWEMRVLLRLMLDELKPERTVELGTYRGFAATLLSLATFGKTISIDNTQYDTEFAVGFASNLELFLMSANEAASAGFVAGKLDGPIDMLFIDDGHFYSDVSTQFAIWKSFVRFGGWICFHDINPLANLGPGGVQPECIQVPRFWNDLKNDHSQDMVEIIAGPEQNHCRGRLPNGGIGILMNRQ